VQELKMKDAFWGYFSLGYVIGFIVGSPALLYAICLIAAK
jgi:hypothetical protein